MGSLGGGSQETFSGRLWHLSAFEQGHNKIHGKTQKSFQTFWGAFIAEEIAEEVAILM
jgi:hypothetical protein